MGKQAEEIARFNDIKKEKDEDEENDNAELARRNALSADELLEEENRQSHEMALELAKQKVPSTWQVRTDPL